MSLKFAELRIVKREDFTALLTNRILLLLWGLFGDSVNETSQRNKSYFLLPTELQTVRKRGSELSIMRQNLPLKLEKRQMGEKNIWSSLIDQSISNHTHRMLMTTKEAIFRVHWYVPRTNVRA